MTDSDAQVISMQEQRAARTRNRPRCAATTASGTRCRNYAVVDDYCRIHADRALPATQAAEGPDPSSSSGEPERPRGGIELFEGLRTVLGSGWLDHVGEVGSFVRRRLSGTYEVDDVGLDIDYAEHLFIPLVRPMHRHYWRVGSTGAERIPEGGALLVANHAGTLPLDVVMLRLDVFEQTGRHPRELGADLVFRLPFVGEAARKTGSTLATGPDAHRLLTGGELAAVWPEGFKGLGKRWKDRYKLQRFGRGGFVATAMRARVPIVPVAIVGSEEIYPLLYDLKIVARTLGLPYFPLVPQLLATPLLGPLAMVPLPSKWLIEYGEPIDTGAYGPDAADDPMAVFDLTDRVRDTIQQMLYRNLMGRRSAFF